MRIINSLPAIGLATIVALGAFTVQASPVTATDPLPTPTPSVEPTPIMDPTPATDPTPAPVPTTDPAPITDPAPTASPTIEPAPTTAPSPVADPTPAPTAAPLAAAAPAPRPVPTLTDRYRRAARVAIAQRFDRYVPGATGPNAFDCSGLVRYAYRKAGISSRLGGGHSARGMLYWARLHGKTTRRHPQVGDVAIWGNGRHAGIYIGNGRVISALNPRQDIRITGLHALGDPFTAFIRTH